MLVKINQHEILNWPGGKFTPKVAHTGIYHRSQKNSPFHSQWRQS